MTSLDSSKRRQWMLLVVGCLAATLVYWPGLSGSFALDDTVFVVSNEAIKVTTTHFSDWVNAAMSFPSGSHQGRW
ncbi:hypothetical protein, partial [Dokdonella sp.]